MSKRKQKPTSKSKLIVAALVVLFVALVVFMLEVTNTTHFFHKSAVVSAPTQPITQLPAQPSSNTAKTPTSNTAPEQGTGTDESGKTVSGVPTDPSQWAASSSGVITLKLPSNNATIASGATITGSASIPQVQYRLIDDQVGVISQGPINVVNGTFTASINFTTQSSTGRLDVFSTEPNGKELNEVQVPVKF